MNIILVNSPCRAPYQIPLGMGYIASTLKSYGHDVRVLDLNAEPRLLLHLEKELERSGCDAIGIGGLSTTYGFVKKFSVLSKKVLPKVKIIAGNMVSTVHFEALLKNSEVDICVIDEGEETIAELIHRIKSFPDLENVNGIAFKKNGNVIVTSPRERIKDLDKLPYPAWDLFPAETYINGPLYSAYGRRTMNISSVRGCPYRCIYCSRPFGAVVHRRSVDGVISEIKELLKRYRIRFVSFTDDLFMSNRGWVKDFSQALLRERIKIGWCASARVNLVDRDLLNLMRRAGCEVLSYGFESGSQRILDGMKKGVKIEQSESAISITRKAGIKPFGSLMIGMLGETRETIKETIDFIKRTDLSLHKFFYTTPYPGTELYEIAKKMGKITVNEDDYMSRFGEMYNRMIVNLTDMTDDELKNAKKDAEEEIKRNFSLKTKSILAREEFRRICADMKKEIRQEGLVSLMPWLIKKIKKKARQWVTTGRT